MNIRQLVFGAVLTFMAGLAQAATITVTTTTDAVNDGLCSLRDAMVVEAYDECQPSDSRRVVAYSDNSGPGCVA